jgi:hypothetical protein
MLGWFLGYIMNSAFGTLDFGPKVAGSLLAPVAFCQGLYVLANLAAIARPMTWSVAHDVLLEYSLAAMLSMLALDAVLYTLVGAYLDQVFPKEFGVQQPWWFPLSAKYWRTGSVTGGELRAEGEGASLSGAGHSKGNDRNGNGDPNVEQVGVCYSVVGGSLNVEQVT